MAALAIPSCTFPDLVSNIILICRHNWLSFCEVTILPACGLQSHSKGSKKPVPMQQHMLQVKPAAMQLLVRPTRHLDSERCTTPDVTSLNVSLLQNL